jgi:hypothetical protein
MNAVPIRVAAAISPRAASPSGHRTNEDRCPAVRLGDRRSPCSLRGQMFGGHERDRGRPRLGAATCLGVHLRADCGLHPGGRGQLSISLGGHEWGRCGGERGDRAGGSLADAGGDRVRYLGEPAGQGGLAGDRRAGGGANRSRLVRCPQMARLALQSRSPHRSPHPEALAAAEEALGIWHELAAANPAGPTGRARRLRGSQNYLGQSALRPASPVRRAGHVLQRSRRAARGR